MAVQSTLAYFATALIVWLTSVIVYRRFFHPLAKIPGPFLAAITHFYIVKFNLFSEKSQFYLQVENLHQQYGKCEISSGLAVLHLAETEALNRTRCSDIT
jgi:hypothetical protein